MKGRPRHFVFLVYLCLLSAPLTAQTVNNDFQQSGLYYGVQQLKVVAGKVSSANGDPIARAEIEILNNAGAPPRFIQTDRAGIFRSDYQFVTNSDEVKHFSVTLKVTKKGFQVANKIVDISATKIVGINLTLRPIQAEDPAVLSQAELIESVAPRLRQVGPTDGLAGKDQKEYARGVQEFLDRKHAEQAVLHFNKVAKDNPTCVRCRTMLALAELSWGDWDDAQQEAGDAANAYVADRKLGSFEPLFVQGVLASWHGDPETASAYLAEAVKFAPRDAFGLKELGRAQCQDLEWMAASESLKKALAAGAGPEAQLMLAEALSWAGTPSEAESALDIYLNGRNPKNMSPRVHSIWANIQARKKDDVAFAAAKIKAKARGEQPVDYIHHPPIKNLPDFEAATDQAPLEAILDAVGKNVLDLFTNLPNICSLEDVHQERLNRNGKTASAQEYKYRYLLATPEQKWGPVIDEYRADLRGNATPQMGTSDSYMLTSGFASAPLVFHPAYQSGSTFRLLGRQKLNGRSTYVVAYAQEPAKARIYGSFQQGKNVSLTFSQGMAWIDSENYQIVRLTTDLLRPASLVRLDKETTEINFNDVKFKKQNVEFWLPNDVIVTLGWNGRTLRNKHVYSDFLVSNVDASQKIGKPKEAEKTAEVPVPTSPRSLTLATPIPNP